MGAWELSERKDIAYLNSDGPRVEHAEHEGRYSVLHKRVDDGGELLPCVVSRTRGGVSRAACCCWSGRVRRTISVRKYNPPTMKPSANSSVDPLVRSSRMPVNVQQQQHMRHCAQRGQLSVLLTADDLKLRTLFTPLPALPLSALNVPPKGDAPPPSEPISTSPGPPSMPSSPRVAEPAAADCPLPESISGSSESIVVVLQLSSFVNRWSHSMESDLHQERELPRPESQSTNKASGGSEGKQLTGSRST